MSFLYDKHFYFHEYCVSYVKLMLISTLRFEKKIVHLRSNSLCHYHSFNRSSVHTSIKVSHVLSLNY